MSIAYLFSNTLGLLHDCLDGPAVIGPAESTVGPVFKSRLSHNCEFKIGILVADLPEAWRFVVSARTGLPGVSIL